MKPPRGLSEAEAAAWAKLAVTVEPMPGRGSSELRELTAKKSKISRSAWAATGGKVAKLSTSRGKLPSAHRSSGPPLAERTSLDSHRDRRIKRGDIEPDFTLDLHGLGLDAAYQRLMRGMAQARAMDARVMLVVTGKPRPVDPADRGTRRGAIRAKILDWLAASEHGAEISAVRNAHRRHGGDGALYLMLRRG